MPYFIGIDGGGTKTECVLGTESAVLSRTTGPSCKIQVVGAQASKAVLHGLINFVCAEAHVPAPEITHVCIGISGSSKAGIGAAMTAMVWELSPAHVEVVGDNVVAMHSAFGERPGVLVIAGTGSIAFGRSADGRSVRVGGWGPAISDEGSGAWIGRQAVTAIMRASDVGQPSSMLQLIMELWQARSREEIATIANQQHLAHFGKLFQVVTSAARTNDPVATKILNDAGSQLAGLATDVITQLHPEPRADGINVAMSGGVFRNSDLVRRAFEHNLRRVRPDASVIQQVADPALGALLLARRAATPQVASA